MEKRLLCPHCGKPIEVVIAKTKSTPEAKIPLIDQIKGALGERMENVDVAEKNGTVTVTPKGFLGRDLWQRINDALKEFEPEWVSAGKESKWVVKTTG